MASGTPACVSQSTMTNQKSKETIKIKKKIRATLFFDGTKNNETNTTIRIDKYKGSANWLSDESSYSNYYSNVSLLNQFLDSENKKPDYDFYIQIYTEGIGTEDNNSDSKIGYGLGQGITGVQSKVQKANNNLANKIIKLIENKLGKPNPNLIVEEIRIDVYGFSRGAAAARHFVNVLLNQTFITAGDIIITMDPLKTVLEKKQYQVNNVKVYFVGLFDTVSSVGLYGTAGGLSNVQELGLDAISAAKSVYHLVAADEHRKNFALTNINSAGGKGKEVFLPGVHSDIGGSYNDYITEKFEIYNTNIPYITEKKYIEIEAELSGLIKGEWFKKTDLFYKDGKRKLKESERIRDAVNNHGNVFIERQGYHPDNLIEKRGIRNSYSRIPLHLMKEKSIENGLSFKGIDTDAKTAIIKGYVPDAILRANTFLKQYAGGHSSEDDWKISFPLPPELEELRENHFHFSADEGAFGMAPRYDENGVRKRKIHNG